MPLYGLADNGSPAAIAESEIDHLGGMHTVDCVAERNLFARGRGKMEFHARERLGAVAATSQLGV